MNEMLVIGGGIYMVALILFHLLFWRIFKWPETLIPLNKVNRSTIQVLNLSITFIFAIFAYLSFVHTDALLNTGLGNTLLILGSGVHPLPSPTEKLKIRLHNTGQTLKIHFFPLQPKSAKSAK